MASNRIMFLRDRRGNVVGCVAMREVSDRQVSYQVSTVNPKDRFNRSHARQLALGRLVESPIVATSDSPFANIHELHQLVMNDIVDFKGGLVKRRGREFNAIPTRSVNAAADWLKFNADPTGDEQ